MARNLLIRAKKRNQETPWEFVLPQPDSMTSTQESSPGSEDRQVSAGEFQTQLRESDNLKWLNTLDDQSLTMAEHLKGKFLVVDFWTSCCINCIHVLAEMDRLE